MEDKRTLRWYNLGMIAFVMVWGFGNIVNNFAQQGLQVIVSWVLILALYFVPYALMVGEMGSTFDSTSGGVSSWVKETSGAKIAYFAGWTYWVVHIPYLAQKPQSVVVALGWVFFQDGSKVSSMNPIVLQLITLVIFLIFMWVASRGITSLKTIGTMAGTAVFIMSILYVILVLTAPALRNIEPATTNISVKSFVPSFKFSYLTTLSMLVFAVGGAEKISPYVNNTKNPEREFPVGMIMLATLVGISAILGSIAMAFMFDANNIPSDLMLNGQYNAFKRLGEYYGLGNLFLIIYACANTIAQISALVFSIDAPLKVLLADADEKYIPKSLMKTNKYGAPIKGYLLTLVLVSILIIVPALGIKDINGLFNWLLNLNSIVMPMRYLWVFFAFIALKKLGTKQNKDGYKFVKNDSLGFAIGMWCFIFTAFACIMGMFPKVEAFSSEWIFQLTLNVITPFVLIGLGLILPIIARREKSRNI
ncbi:amino acid permease [uncultured Clostridium sp.]|uniref:APC family permease n=1 Tax=uncultured Clostridium sp. TaxID=59620 RepID=UPI0025D43FDD|nr:amino acid permease [uncultured Clostridium sp.]